MLCHNDALIVQAVGVSRNRNPTCVMQAPVLPVFSDVVLQPAAFLSQHLPPLLDTLVPPGYARQASTCEMLCMCFKYLTSHSSCLHCCVAKTHP